MYTIIIGSFDGRGDNKIGAVLKEVLAKPPRRKEFILREPL